MSKKKKLKCISLIKDSVLDKTNSSPREMKVAYIWLRVCMDRIYFAETENLLLKSL